MFGSIRDLERLKFFPDEFKETDILKFLRTIFAPTKTWITLHYISVNLSKSKVLTMTRKHIRRR